MTVEQLRIRFTPAHLREPQAWFIPGSRPENWLSEIVGWGVPHSAISLRLVAALPRRSNSNRLSCDSQRQIVTARFQVLSALWMRCGEALSAGGSAAGTRGRGT